MDYTIRPISNVKIDDGDKFGEGWFPGTGGGRLVAGVDYVCHWTEMNPPADEPLIVEAE